jgi:2-hydroxymuconate-semialdehyde hydrolase
MTVQALNLEVAHEIEANGIQTNYHDLGNGRTTVLLHGSGPGVSAWANWRLSLPALAERMRVVAPDIVGFGYTERPAGIRYGLDTWVDHLVGFLDALELERVSLVGNSFGGALALAVATRHPDRVERLVLMGSAGLTFPITAALDDVWGYQPSVQDMRRMLDLFAFDRTLVNDELAELRYHASVRPGVQEAYSAMFPAPRQRWVDALATPEDEIAALPHETLVVHGREDHVIPVDASLRLFQLVPHAQLHLFGECGHWTQIEHAAAFNLLVANFLDR